MTGLFLLRFVYLGLTQITGTIVIPAPFAAACYVSASTTAGPRPLTARVLIAVMTWLIRRRPEHAPADADQAIYGITTRSSGSTMCTANCV